MVNDVLRMVESPDVSAIPAMAANRQKTIGRNFFMEEQFVYQRYLTV